MERRVQHAVLSSICACVLLLISACGSEPESPTTAGAGADSAGADVAPQPSREEAAALEVPQDQPPLANYVPTWSRDVAPILFDNCVTCHRPSGGAPFPLQTFTDARRRAKQIAIVTASRYMPPWPPAPGEHALFGARLLSDRQLAVLRTWADSGRSEGDPADAPELPTFAEGWQMGEPDLVVSMPIAFEVPAAGDDIFRNFVLPVEIVGTHYVQAMEIRPDNRLVVHHASMAADRSRQARRKDAEEEGLGFGGIEIFSETDEPNGFFMTYKPGTISNPGRPEMSWRVDGRTDLVLNVHLQPTGKPESLRVDVGLYFAQSPPTLHPFLLRLDNDRAIDIPPGEAEFIVTDEFVLPIDVQVLGAYPHMHFLGKNVECYATLPDGSRQNLIEIPTWDFYWQASYSYKEPVFLPAGTKISMQLTFDNSADNPLNPHSPPQRILSGNRSADEMARLALRVLPEDKSGAFVLQAEMMRARLRKDPTSADSRTRLGNALRSLGQNERAIRRYREAAQINPSDFLSRNNLAGLLWETGQPEEAEQELLSILEASPDYLKAHENLAFMLSARGALDEAQAHLERMLELDSELADVHHKLGRLHARAKRPKEARTSFLAALQVDPAHIGATFDLGSLLASLGQFSQAIERFEYVLVLDPGHDGARQNLVRVRELDK